jgi:hypothetical protein
VSATATPTRKPTRTRLRATPPPRRNKTAIWFVLGGVVFLIVVAPVALFAGAGNPPCPSSLAGGQSPVGGIDDAGGSAPAGHFAAPLQMREGQWYRFGATEYGPPATGDYGSDPDPGQSDLATHPNSFAELSTLDSNPANSPADTFTFMDADALGNLPYGTNLRVRGPSGDELVLAKRDTGYGQGPEGQTGGVIYRIDVWNGVAGQLGVSKSPVAAELAPTSGTAPTLDQTPASGPPGKTGACSSAGGELGPLQLTPGQTAQINSQTGDASAPADAPRPVKLAIAAANEIHAKPYSTQDPDGSGAASHAYGPLSRLWPAYDCSGSTSFVLYKAGLFGPNAWVSGQFMNWGAPGPGKWISVYANSGHVFVSIAGRAFDTSNYGGPNIPSSPYAFGPRWRTDPTGNLADGDAYAVRHPAGAWNDPT